MMRTRTVDRAGKRLEQQAFEEAISAGRLSEDPASEVYAGRFMYMHTDLLGDHFKDRETREYLPQADVSLLEFVMFGRRGVVS